MRITEGSILDGEKQPHPVDSSINKLLEDLIEDGEVSNKVALVNSETGVTVTYKELNEKANRVARTLLGRIKNGGVKTNADGDYIVAVRFRPSEELIVTLLALFKAGLAYVPLAPNWPEGRVRHVIEDSGPVMIITNMDQSDVLYDAQKDLPVRKKREVVYYDELEEEGLTMSADNIPRNQAVNSDISGGDRLYSVLYTSGSTGLPKGVKHIHSAALNRFYWQWRHWPYLEHETCVFKTTLTFVDSVTEIWSPLLSGKKLVIFPTKVTQNVEKFIEYLEKYQIGRIFVVTSLVRNILSFLNLKKGVKKQLQSVKIWECSAETVTQDVLMAFYDYFAPGTVISNFYGSTEMMDVTYESFTCAQDVMNSVFNEKIPIGRPVDNSRAYVLDDGLQPVGERQVGSLYVSSRNLGRGYVGDKQGSFVKNHLNESGEVDHILLYKTGDYVQVNQGRLYYEGRLDSQVKVRGHRVDLMEIEKAVLEVEGVIKTIVLCYKPGDSQQRILCYYTVKEGQFLHEKKLETMLAEKLPDYMLPRLFKLPTFPLLVNGKVDRQILLEKYEESLSCRNFTFETKELEEHVCPAMFDVARALLESVTAVCCDGTRKPSLGDNFFDIGGDSINMVEVLARLQEMGYTASISTFVTSNNLAAIVTSIATHDILESDGLGNDEYTSEVLREDHKEVVMDMISRSFADKGDLTTLAQVNYDHIKDQMEALWTSMLAANLCLVARNGAGDLIGSCINFDARSEEAEPLCATAAFSRTMTEEERREERKRRRREREEGEEVPLSVVDFLEVIEHPLKDKHLPQEKGQYIYTSMLGTAKDLSTSENVKVVMFLEQANLRHAQARGYRGVFTTNANRLTQLISRSLDYTILSSVHVNQYEDDQGRRPFASAPDDLVCEVAIKTF